MASEIEILEGIMIGRFINRLLVALLGEDEVNGFDVVEAADVSTGLVF